MSTSTEGPGLHSHPDRTKTWWTIVADIPFGEGKATVVLHRPGPTYEIAARDIFQNHFVRAAFQGYHVPIRGDLEESLTPESASLILKAFAGKK